RNDLRKILVAQLAGDRPENARALRVQLIVDDDDRIVIETQIRTVRPAQLVFRAYHHAVHDLALFDRAIRRRFFDVRLDDVADERVPLTGFVQHPNRPRDPRAGIVGYIQIGTQLDHASTFSTCRD